MGRIYRVLFRIEITIVAAMIVSAATLGQGVGNGTDGSPHISGVINKYAYLVDNAFSCTNRLSVNKASIFKPGDLVLIVQMQGALVDESNTASYGTVTDLNGAGNYEFADVAYVEGNEIVLEYALINSYSESGATQIIEVPQYENPVVAGSITCPPWNGKTGGIVALDAIGEVTLEASINVIGKGFRGGEHERGLHILDITFDYIAETPDPTWYSRKGEGICGYGVEPFLSGRGAPANGGGGGNIHTTGGGGGANYGTGGDGGWGYPVDMSGDEKLVFGLGGHSLHYASGDNKLFMGGGGGAGHEHFGNGTSGARGGGIVLLSCNRLVSNDYDILARGATSASSGAYGDGAGGAGAGGTVLLHVNNIQSALDGDIAGGLGGNSIGDGFGPGGGGGGGFCNVKGINVPVNLVVMSPGGLPGVAGGSPYGAQGGGNGNVTSGLQIPFNKQYRVVNADFDFTVTESSNGSGFTIKFDNLSDGGDHSMWYFGDNDTDTLRHPLHNYDIDRSYDIMLIESNDMCGDTSLKTYSTQLDIPSAFTPNGDGINDHFTVFGSNIIDYEISIYNRWGQVVYFSSDKSELNDLNKGWDGYSKGKAQVMGTYVYSINALSLAGTAIIQTGNLVLVR